MNGGRYPENAQARAILIRNDIDPYCGCANLAITRNWCHSSDYAKHVLNELIKAEKQKDIEATLTALASAHNKCRQFSTDGRVDENAEKDEWEKD